MEGFTLLGLMLAHVTGNNVWVLTSAFLDPLNNGSCFDRALNKLGD